MKTISEFINGSINSTNETTKKLREMTESLINVTKDFKDRQESVDKSVDDLNEIINIIKEFNWRSIDDGYPEIEENVDVYGFINYDKLQFRIADSAYLGNGEWDFGHGGRDNEDMKALGYTVTHWRKIGVPSN